MGTYSKTTMRKPWQWKEAMAEKIINGVGSQKSSPGVLELPTENRNAVLLPRALTVHMGHSPENSCNCTKKEKKKRLNVAGYQQTSLMTDICLVL